MIGVCRSRVALGLALLHDQRQFLLERLGLLSRDVGATAIREDQPASERDGEELHVSIVATDRGIARPW